MTNLIDYHIHTTRCNHAEGAMAEYVEKALKAGLKEMGFSDHLPLSPAPKAIIGRDWAMREEEMQAYVNDVYDLQRSYLNITIKLGIEADFFLDHQSNKKTKALLDKFEWDYVIGSIHHIGSWVIDSSEYLYEFDKRDLYKTYETYFELVVAAANSGIYDYIGHIDVIKKYGYVPKDDLSSLYRDLAKEIKRSGIAFEINTSGLRKPANELYPAKGLLKELLGLGVPVTLGSDSHSPFEVGKDFDIAVSLLKEFGISELATFKNRQRIMMPLE